MPGPRPVQVDVPAFHCLDCEVGWIAESSCFCCGRDGTVGSLLTTGLVDPAPRAGWAGPLARPGAHRTVAARVTRSARPAPIT